ncbi:MAG: NAD(P)/FAD-dependent oxidoreductase [Deltaproteobacteria bacterium]|nr:NAD(P)/FAD-dependent oxidoreductase [Deltaproteobacteria bacterium]
MDTHKQPHVVVIGGGFGGLAVARKLAKAPVRITLVDRRNHHLFQPLLYQVATAALNAADIAYPIRAALHKQKNVRVLLAEAKSIDVDTRRVILDDGELHYDFLVVATGATHSYFGRDDWEQYAPGLKTVEDALEIRRRVFLAYEAAERDSEAATQREWLTFAVVGGGPTGVELAGSLGEIGLHTLANDFRTIDPTQVRVLLLEGRDRVLGAYPPKLSEAAKQSLETRQVEVRLNSKVVGIDAGGITVESNGKTERIATRTVLWAAGVQASPLAKTLGVPLDRSGRVVVRPDLSIPQHPEVFVIGDLAKMISEGNEVPGVAQGALQGGAHVAKLIIAELENRATRTEFRYWDKGNMATIGRASAVVATKRVAISGLFAWLLWWVVHILYLVGFKNRFVVIFSWMWSWLTFRRGARLITGEVGTLPPVRLIGADGTIQLPAGAPSIVSLPVPVEDERRVHSA